MTAIALILAFALCIVLAWALHLHRVHEIDKAAIHRLYGELADALAELAEFREGAIEHDPHEGPGSNGAGNGSATSLH